jgi:predicted 3-demethylubiquinone-9 3-methyltransferase (glyoxalase superfamily)
LQNTEEAAVPEICPMLWFDDQAEAAAAFYVSVFPNSRIIRKAPRPAGAPGAPGETMVVEFELNGKRYSALNGGPMFKFTEAVSLVVECKSQAEIDHYWSALAADGGEEGRCGWLKDRFGLSWQVLPDLIPKVMSEDPVRAGKAMAAVMTMRKLDLAAIEAAAAA